MGRNSCSLYVHRSEVRQPWPELPQPTLLLPAWRGVLASPKYQNELSKGGVATTTPKSTQDNLPCGILWFALHGLLSLSFETQVSR